MPTLQLRRDGDSVFVVPNMLQYQRCVAVLLVLDLQTRRWGFVIPRQRAGPDAACWRLQKYDLPDLHAAVRNAGSLQMLVLSRAREPLTQFRRLTEST
ncbi:MAG TPA: hypothetical protein VK968_18275 [Roseimicrobium sp.]|nr:hypothetical protein [Roseimicrobium sp.]